MFKECLNIMDTIIIKQINEKDFTMNIGDLKTVQDLKNLLKTDLNLKSCSQMLFYAGKELINEKKLSDYNFQKGSSIIRYCKNTGG